MFVFIHSTNKIHRKSFNDNYINYIFRTNYVKLGIFLWFRTLHTKKIRTSVFEETTFILLKVGVRQQDSFVWIGLEPPDLARCKIEINQAKAARPPPK